MSPNTQHSSTSAIGYLLLGVAGGLGLDLSAKGLLATYSVEQFVFLRSTVGGYRRGSPVRASSRRLTYSLFVLKSALRFQRDSVDVPSRKTRNLCRRYLQSLGNPIEKVDLQYADNLVTTKHVG